MDGLIPIFEDHSLPQINQLLSGALRCPECGAGTGQLTAMSEDRVIRPRYLIACRECEYKGPFGKNLMAALEQWNKPMSLFAYLKKKWAKSDGFFISKKKWARA